MKRTRIAAAVLSTGLAFTGAAAITTSAEAHTTGIHDNCTELHKKWPHGVGRRGATDKGGNVTNFKRNTKAYNRADAHNGTLDADNDKIACESA